MTAHEIFQQRFNALDVTTRAALVFRYREGLPLAHVAQLVDRPARKLGPLLDRTLAELCEAGALPAAAEPAAAGPASGDPASAGPASAGPTADPAQALRDELDALRGDPALSSFSLVSAVRAEQNRRGLLRGGVMRRFA
ncbi:hypothetical protein ABH920_009417 [Catenulispora sp. EB89]|uniref:hypothetical protein n=1 Tax=Catenulispora sp. EB89 TaxID=3156257 RepID=UPI0035179B88